MKANDECTASGTETIRHCVQQLFKGAEFIVHRNPQGLKGARSWVMSEPTPPLSALLHLSHRRENEYREVPDLRPRRASRERWAEISSSPKVFRTLANSLSVKRVMRASAVSPELWFIRISTGPACLKKPRSSLVELIRRHLHRPRCHGQNHVQLRPRSSVAKITRQERKLVSVGRQAFGSSGTCICVLVDAKDPGARFKE